MHRTPTRALISIALALVLLPACADGGAAMKEAVSPAAMAPPAPPPEPDGVRPPTVDVGSTSTGTNLVPGNFFGAPPVPAPASKSPPSDAPRTVAEGASQAAVRAPLLIYTAEITMAVFEVNVALSRVEALGREVGGFLAKRDDHSITIRVPAERFDEAVRRVEGVGDMLHRNVTAQDVTEEFRDLEVRLKSAHAVQQRLTELLAKAVKVEESIAIERELDRVSGDIERIEGRIKFLRDRAAFSTITVSFEPKPQEQVGTKEVRLPVPWLYDLGLRRLLSL